MKLQQSQLDLKLAHRNLDFVKEEAIRAQQQQQQHKREQAGGASTSGQQEWPGLGSGGAAAASPSSQRGQKCHQQKQNPAASQKYGGLSKEEWWEQARQQQQQEWKQGGCGAGAFTSRPTRCEYEDPTCRGSNPSSNSNPAGARSGGRALFPCPGNAAPELGSGASEQVLRTFLLQAGMEDKDTRGERAMQKGRQNARRHIYILHRGLPHCFSPVLTPASSRPCSRRHDLR
jgi:hypothetical protein